MTFGERLRQQRLAKGVSVSEVANETRISGRYLEALESGNHAVLPGSIFARSFARQYARYVGLDESLIEDELQAAFRPEVPIPPELLSDRQEVVPTGPVFNRDAAISFLERLPRPSLTLVAALGGCTLLYMGWQRVVLERDAQGPLDEPIASSSPMAPPATARGPVSGSQADAQSLAIPGLMSPLASPAAQAPVSAAGSLEIQVPPANTSGMHINVMASQATWVSITANGRTVFTGVLEPNSSRVLRGVESAKMVIGNAGGVQVLTDGRNIGPIGPPGQVRVLMLSPEGPRIVTTGEPARPEPAVPQTGNATL